MSPRSGAIVEAAVVEHRRRFRHRWYRTPSFVAGLSIIVLIALLAVFAPLVTPHDPIQQDLLPHLQGPSLEPPARHRRARPRRPVAARSTPRASTCVIAFLAVLFPFVLGTVDRLLSGYYGRVGGLALERLVDVVVAFPFFVLVIALVFVLGSGTRNIYIAITIVGWVSYTRIVRGEVLVAKRREYVLAARRRASRAPASSAATCCRT